MQSNRPYVLTIAGFDPSSGAGLTADIKTFEQLKVYGLAVCTGITLQSEDEFVSVTWRPLEEVKKEVEFLLQKYQVNAVKFGIVPSLKWLEVLTEVIKNQNKLIPIIVDPIWKSSTGFEFADFRNMDKLKSLLSNITLLTPNKDELKLIAGEQDTSSFAQTLSAYVNVLVKGGHDSLNPGRDLFYDSEKYTELHSGVRSVNPKHGSGCVLSAAIAAFIAKDNCDALQACTNAKKYVENFLMSNKSLLGYHAS